MNEQIRKAKENVDIATRVLLRAVQAIYPIGTVIDVNLGRARIRARVTGHHGAYAPQEG